MFDPIIFVLIKIVELYRYLLLAFVVLSWLIAFNVLNTRNQVVAGIADFLYKITEPVLAPIRRRLPNMGGLDLSPIIVFFLLLLIELYLYKLLSPNF